MTHDDVIKIGTILNRWFMDQYYFVDYDYPISLGYEIEGKKTLLIYTNRPGILIGRKGVNINALQEKLKDEGFNLNIHFKELGTRYFQRIKRDSWLDKLKKKFKRDR